MNRPESKPSGTAGYSMIELVIASMLLAMMIGAVASLSVTGGQAQEYARRLNRVTEITQTLIDDMRLELVSSVRIFGNDAEGVANLALLDLDGAPASLTGLKLPTVADSETVRADTLGNEITGNSMFFAKLAWSDRYICTSTNEYLVDVYRWVYYYLAPEDGGPDPSHPIGLNIVRIVSEPLIDAASIDRITDPLDQAEVLLHLFNATADANGVTHDAAEVVWVRGALPSVTGTFRHIDSSDGSLSDSPLSPRPDPWSVLRMDNEVVGLLSYRHHSIASIYSQESFGVGRYGLESTSGEGFPHGLEVQVVGPSAARQILIHMVTSSTQKSGRYAWCDMQVSVDARDL
jgi:type II secretory pathway pseudopilin PulG